MVTYFKYFKHFNYIFKVKFDLLIYIICKKTVSLYVNEIKIAWCKVLKLYLPNANLDIPFDKRFL